MKLKTRFTYLTCNVSGKPQHDMNACLIRHFFCAKIMIVNGNKGLNERI